MSVQPTYMLSLRLADFERPPDDPVEFMYFWANASAYPFHGATQFGVYKRDLDAFLDEIDTMVDKLSGEAHLRCGAGETVYFEMKAYYYGRLGHIAVELEIADLGMFERMRRTLIDMPSEPELLGQFANELREMKDVGEEAILTTNV
jgi:hypothetical protein